MRRGTLGVWVVSLLIGCDGGGPDENSPFRDPTSSGGSAAPLDGAAAESSSEGGGDELPPSTTPGQDDGPPPPTTNDGGGTTTDDGGVTSTVTVIPSDEGNDTGTSATATAATTEGVGEAPPDTPGITVDATIGSEWAEGSCTNVSVTNTQTIALRWQVSLAIRGTFQMNSPWSAEATLYGDVAVFTGSAMANNVSLQPGASAMFGFCVDF